VIASSADLSAENHIAAAEIVAVTKLDGRSIGSGKPGPTTQALAKRFKALATRGD